MTRSKLITIIISMFFATGCRSDENLVATNTTISFVTEPTESMISDGSSNEFSSPSIESDLVNTESGQNDYDDLSNYVGRYANRYPYEVRIEKLDEIYEFPSPGYVDVYQENNHLNIGFIYEIGINSNVFPTLLDEIKQDDWPRSESGEYYVYYGELVNLQKNVFASNGKWPNDLKLMEDICDDSIDFYVVFKNEGLYVYFDDIDMETIYDSISDKDPHFIRYFGQTENYDGEKESSAH